MDIKSLYNKLILIKGSFTTKQNGIYNCIEDHISLVKWTGSENVYMQFLLKQQAINI